MRATFLAAFLVASLLAACGPEEPAAEEAAKSCEGTAAAFVPARGWDHAEYGTDLAYEDNPPSSGPHWPIWAFQTVYDEAVPREVWLHNVEHGALVMLYRPDAPEETIRLLRDLYDELPPDPVCGHRRALLTPDPELDSVVAAVTAEHVLEGDTFDRDEFRAFALACRGTAPEDVCADGDYTPGGP